MKPWREVAVPHADVLKGTFQQSEFAADITAVRTGKAPDEYKDAAAFYTRTFITEGMGLLLTQVAQRAPEPPSSLVLVDLDEGPRVLSRVDAPAAELPQIGARVRARVARRGAEAVLVFDMERGGAHG